MKKLFLLSYLLFSCITTHAQNLVNNPSFENYIQCPIGFHLFNGYIQDWYGFNPSGPSFFHSCAPLPDGVPINSYGFQYPHTGNGYACILVYNYFHDADKRTYVEGHFNSVLKKDSVYCVNYFVSNSDYSLGAIKNVDAHISDSLIDWNNNVGFVLVNILPQIKSQQILNDSIGWINVSGLYKAHGGEQYITIGNFTFDSNTNVLSFQPGNPIQVSYFIDDVSVNTTNFIAPDLGNDTVICENATPYILTAPSGYDNYLWSNGSTGNILAVSDSGTYWVNCVANGCGELSDTIHIGFVETPQLDLGNDSILCTGTTLNISAQPGFFLYNWNTNDTTATITVSDSGLYVVQATELCGIQFDSIHITLDSLPDILIDIGTDSTLCQNGMNIPLVLSSTQPLPNYIWNNGDTSSVLTVTKKGWYWLQSTYHCGFIRSDSIFIDECPPDSITGLYIPNSFTPNDDGRNDFFEAVQYNVTITEIKIFNRWGNVVFSGEHDFSWNGKYQNLECPAGVYIYTLYFRKSTDVVTQKIGRVSLIR